MAEQVCQQCGNVKAEVETGMFISVDRYNLLTVIEQAISEAQAYKGRPGIPVVLVGHDVRVPIILQEGITVLQVIEIAAILFGLSGKVELRDETGWIYATSQRIDRPWSKLFFWETTK